jgi:hypothetical protein
MKAILTALIMCASVFVASAEPMPSSVSSWEGEFRRMEDDVVVRIDGHDPVVLCFYQLPTGSRGIVVGIATSDGEMIISPTASQKGVQPIYRMHVATVRSREEAELSLIFDVQGQGGCKCVDRYSLKKGSVSFIGRMFYGGRHDPVWREEQTANQALQTTPMTRSEI